MCVEEVRFLSVSLFPILPLSYPPLRSSVLFFHEDIYTLEALATALDAYQGAVLVVSHDAHFIRDVCDELWIINKLKKGATQPQHTHCNYGSAGGKKEKHLVNPNKLKQPEAKPEDQTYTGMVVKKSVPPSDDDGGENTGPGIDDLMDAYINSLKLS